MAATIKTDIVEAVCTQCYSVIKYNLHSHYNAQFGVWVKETIPKDIRCLNCQPKTYALTLP